MALFASTIVAIPRVWIALPNYPDLWYLAHTATSLLVGPPQLARRRAGEKLNSFLRLELGLRRPPTPTTIPTTLKNLLTSPAPRNSKENVFRQKGGSSSSNHHFTLETLSEPAFCLLLNISCVNIKLVDFSKRKIVKFQKSKNNFSLEISSQVV